MPARRETEIELAGFNLPPTRSEAAACRPLASTALPIDGNRFRAARALNVLATEGAELIEAEPNDAPGEATPITAPASVNGRIWTTRDGQPTDADLFRFEAKAGETWIVETEGERRGSPVDTRLEVLDAAGRPIHAAAAAGGARQLSGVPRHRFQFAAECGRKIGKRWSSTNLCICRVRFAAFSACRKAPIRNLSFMVWAAGGETTSTPAPPATRWAIPFIPLNPTRQTKSSRPNGLPVFPLEYSNDDDMERKLGATRGSRSPPRPMAQYLVRVSDTRGLSGDRFVYRLNVRKPQPGFDARLADANPTVSRGSGRRLTFTVDRHDGFDGDIGIEVSGLPAGFTVSPVIVQAGHVEARAVLVAAADAAAPPPEAWQTVKIVAKARIGEQDIVKEVNALGQVKLADKPNLLVRLEPAETHDRAGHHHHRHAQSRDAMGSTTACSSMSTICRTASLSTISGSMACSSPKAKPSGRSF